MAGFREFITGEVLTAANVNDFLMDQSVMKFANAAARDSALGTAVSVGNALREGMVAYLDDTDEVIKYDGTSWSRVGEPSKLVAVHSVTKADTFTTSSTSYVTVTDLEVTFTPENAGNRLLLMWTVAVSGGDASSSAVRQMISPFRDGNNLVTPASPGSRTPSLFAVNNRGLTGPAITMWLVSGQLDVPATAATPTTFDIRTLSPSTVALYVNRTSGDADESASARGVSSITVLEYRP